MNTKKPSHCDKKQQLNRAVRLGHHYGLCYPSIVTRLAQHLYGRALILVGQFLIASWGSFTRTVTRLLTLAGLIPQLARQLFRKSLNYLDFIGHKCSCLAQLTGKSQSHAHWSGTKQLPFKCDLFLSLAPVGVFARSLQGLNLLRRNTMLISIGLIGLISSTSSTQLIQGRM